MRRGIVLRVGELFLKRGNRPMFEKALADRLKNVTRLHGQFELHRGQGRFYLVGDAHPNVIDELSDVFGLASLSPVTYVDKDTEAICAVAIDLARRAVEEGAKTFSVAARRADKRFPLTSPQLNVAVGSAVVDATPLTVDLEGPDVTIGVEIGPKLSFVFTEIIKGSGGLPVGVSGDAILLLSGGIDSPVAGHLMQKRGLRLAGVHFHSAPWTSAASQEKVRTLAARLALRQGSMPLVMVPFGPVQEAIREAVDETYRVILYRRFMLRIAERIAARREARALITGDSLGQVASQTLENIDCVEAATNMLVLRPLIGYDKAEVIALARKIDTFAISAQPHDDCCSLFVPRHPQTKGTHKQASRFERRLDVDALIDDALGAAEHEVISPLSS